MNGSGGRGHQPSTTREPTLKNIYSCISLGPRALSSNTFAASDKLLCEAILTSSNKEGGGSWIWIRPIFVDPLHVQSL